MMCSDKKLMSEYASSMRSKTGMKTLFGKKNIKKDNTEGKVGSCIAEICLHHISHSSWSL